MNAINFVVRSRAGDLKTGSLGGDDQGFVINAGTGNDISLNIRQSDLRGYDRAGDDLLITLADGRVIVVQGYFAEGSDSRLFLSADSILNEVSFADNGDGALFAQYGPTESWGKWSPDDELIFFEDPAVVADAMYPAGGEEEVSMLGAGLLGAAGLLSPAALGAAGLAGAALLAGGGSSDKDDGADAAADDSGTSGGGGSKGGGSNGGGSTWIAPTVDDANAEIELGGNDEPSITVTGTANPGSTVTVVIGDETVTGTAGDDRTWEVVFEGDDFPDDGVYEDIDVTVVDPNSTVTELDGPTFEIDTTPPVIETTSGTVSVGDIFNEDGYNDGVSISGNGEPGATLTVTVGDHSETTTVSEDGSWTFTFDETVFGEGEYTSEVTLTSTDSFGNSTTVTDQIQIDTINSITMDTETVAEDGIINGGERAAGVVLTGTTQAGSTVEVTVQGQVLTATVETDGSWSVIIPAAQIPEGETTLSVLATSTDTAGNISTTTGSIEIDTFTNVTINTATLEGDGIVNAAEHVDGITLTGTAQAGASVVVTLGGVSHTATVSTDGSWSVDFASAELPTGETTLSATAVATDAAGNVASASGDVNIDTLVRNFAITTTPGGADGIINAEEAAAGLTLNGTTEPGATVMVTLDGVTLPASVSADGSWTVTYDSSQMPSGEGTVVLTAVSTDIAGNTETISQNVMVDTDAGILTISPAPVEGDDLVNFVEASDGVVLLGTSNPLQMVTVTMNGVSHVVQTDASGIWRAPFASHELQQGTYTADITATITDSAGNTLTRTDTLRFDTEVLNFAVSSDPIEGDNIINAAEAADGVILSGTTEPGGTVQIVLEGISYTAAVATDGSWSVGLPSSAFSANTEETLVAQVKTVDLAGNTAETTVDLVVDTYVNELSMSDAPVTGDHVINAVEAMEGFDLNGQVEPGSTVTVTIGGVAHTASVAADGSWTVNIPPASVPAGTLEAPILIEATDIAGNTTSITESISIDTDVPDDLEWVGYGRNDSGVDLIRTEMTEDEVSILQLVEGAVPSVAEVGIESSIDLAPLNQTWHSFDTEVADGTKLVVTSTDDAGNTSGALFITDDPATNAVDLTDAEVNVLAPHQIEVIDLHFAEDSNFTITEAQLLALSDTTDTLVVRGGSDDTVTINGAQAQGQTAQDGQIYNVFSLGDATLLIEDDINVNPVI